MVAIALLCAIIYYTVLLVQAMMVVVTLCRRQENFEALSESAKKRYSVKHIYNKEDVIVHVLDRKSSSRLSVSL